jgi:predicted acylesterase/phospholipase RssA
MDIDTLILSGGGPSGVAYFGVLRALFEKKILTKDLNGINEIITTSVGIICSIIMILQIPIEMSTQIIMKYDLSNLLNSNTLNIDDLLVEFGLFTTDGVRKLIQTLLKNFAKEEDFTLQEFYDKTKIKLTVKVFNVTLKQVKYISYETDPKLSLLTLVEMTTAIPFFFKPVEYNENIYVDGGLRGHFPIEECQSKNYLGIFIVGGTLENSDLMETIPILDFALSLMINQDQVVYDIKNENEDPRIIYNQIEYGLNFDMPEKDKTEIIMKSYDTTINHIKRHLEKDKV